MANLRLNMIQYSFVDKIKKHPQEFINDLGITYKKCEPMPIGDCWLFFDCENIPNVLPSFIEIIENKKPLHYYKG